MIKKKKYKIDPGLIKEYPHLLGHKLGYTKLEPIHSKWIRDIWFSDSGGKFISGVYGDDADRASGGGHERRPHAHAHENDAKPPVV